MKFELDKATEILRQTPYVLARLMENISDEWVVGESDQNNWSPYDVLGHLIHGDETDWMTRAEIILTQEGDRRFEPFDRLAQFRNSQGKSMSDLLIEFAHLRNANIERLVSWG